MKVTRLKAVLAGFGLPTVAVWVQQSPSHVEHSSDVTPVSVSRYEDVTGGRAEAYILKSVATERK